MAEARRVLANGGVAIFSFLDLITTSSYRRFSNMFGGTGLAVVTS